MNGHGAMWLAAVALDLTRGEPPRRVHPVVLVGRAIEGLERRSPRAPRAQLACGLVLVGLPALVMTAAGVLAERLRPTPLRVLAAIWLVKSSFALRDLLSAAARVRSALRRGDLGAGRAELRALVSREVAQLDEAHIASAAVESLAENLSDSYVAPLCYYVVGGLPAALAYRAVNTADAMVGYRGRYEHLGKAAARLDDVLNFVPARLSALALVTAAPLVGLSASRALETARRDHVLTESPNAGWPMAAAAGACGVWLEKPGHYRLGEGRAPTVDHIAVAGRLVLAGALLATVAALALWWVRDA